MSDRAKFLSTVSRVLGRDRAVRPDAPAATGLSTSHNEVCEIARRIRAEMQEHATELMDELASAAERAGWRIHCASNPEDVADVIVDICRTAAIKSALRSTHDVLEKSPVVESLKAAGVDIKTMQARRDTAETIRADRAALRQAVFAVDAGITGGDYAIAETGTLVLHPRRGLSRLVSLAPPRHIAVVEKGTVLPSLDELFALEREAHLGGTLSGSMNLITGPSRTGDIEATIAVGIHGPFEVHMVLLG